MIPAIGPLLLVEDDPNDIHLFKRALAMAGDEIPLRVVRDGDEALAYLQGLGPFADRGLHPVPLLIVLDFKLPHRTGVEVLAWLRSEPLLKGIPVVILTSSQEPQDVARAQALGVDAYEVKPVHFPELREIVRSIRARWVALSKAKTNPPS